MTYLSSMQTSNTKAAIKHFETETYSAIKIYSEMRSAWENYKKDASDNNEASIVVLNAAVIYIHKR